jgi:hypothetical protein
MADLTKHVSGTFSLRRTKEGSTVVVMIALCLLDLPVRGWDIFHGGRWLDAHEAAQAVRNGLGKDRILAGVGYSMGLVNLCRLHFCLLCFRRRLSLNPFAAIRAIILGINDARSGSECAFDVAFAISGGLDMRYDTYFGRTQRLWQPIIAKDLRGSFVVGKWGERVRSRLTKKQMKALMRA